MAAERQEPGPSTAAKAPEAFRTISEVADILETPPHVLRFWETKFTQLKPVKRAGGRRYYRPADLALLGGIKRLLHDEGMTIRGVQKMLREQGVRHVAGLAAPASDAPADEAPADEAPPSMPEATAAPLDAPDEAPAAPTERAAPRDLFEAAVPAAPAAPEAEAALPDGRRPATRLRALEAPLDAQQAAALQALQARVAALHARLRGAVEATRG